MKQKDCDAAPQGGFELLTSLVSKIDYGRGEYRQLPAATTAPSRGRQKRQKDVEVSEDQNGKRLHHQTRRLVAYRKSEDFTNISQGQDQLRGLALTTIHPQVVMGSTRLGTPFRLSSSDAIVYAITIYIL